ncbi:MAG: hypothetical protein FD147_29 [Chloroflexi bacterium]|nr:MAG: hypothetical protein FD147_29 [Chloroflexota bacterium]MBA4374656.1 hypothetical protein [Anaerolinea sp.]
MQSLRNPPLIGIVGVCASGKTTLIANLARMGYNCRHIAQEHSYVQDMWKRLTDPDVLVFLDVSYKYTCERRNLNWTEEEYKEQVHRLRNARSRADVILNTDDLTPEEITTLAVTKIEFVISSIRQTMT